MVVLEVVFDRISTDAGQAYPCKSPRCCSRDCPCCWPVGHAYGLKYTSVEYSKLIPIPGIANAVHVYRTVHYNVLYGTVYRHNGHVVVTALRLRCTV